MLTSSGTLVHIQIIQHVTLYTLYIEVRVDDRVKPLTLTLETMVYIQHWFLLTMKVMFF